MANNHKIFIFKIGNIPFGVYINEVVEVIRPKEVCNIKKAKKYILGSFISREKRIILFDLPNYFGLKRNSQKINVIVSNIKDLLVGFLVDNFYGVSSAPAETVTLPEDIFKLKKSIKVGYIQGQLVQIISFKNIITQTRLVELKKLKI